MYAATIPSVLCLSSQSLTEPDLQALRVSEMSRRNAAAPPDGALLLAKVDASMAALPSFSKLHAPPCVHTHACVHACTVHSPACAHG